MKKIYGSDENLCLWLRDTTEERGLCLYSAERIEALLAENAKLIAERDILKSILIDCAKTVGAYASFNCSIDFLNEIPKEIELKIGKMQAEREAVKSDLDMCKLCADSYEDELKKFYAEREAMMKQSLAVFFGKMPESNGKTNWTAILYRKNSDDFMGGVGDGYTLARSEYEDRVRYDADCVRYLIGEIDKEPFILDYDSDKHSGYVDQLPAQQIPEGYALVPIDPTDEMVEMGARNIFSYATIDRSAKEVYKAMLSASQPKGDV